MKTIQRLLVAGIGMAGLVAIVCSADPPAPAKPVHSPAPMVEVTALNAPPPAADALDANVIEYDNTDIQTVLRTLANKAGVNLIIGDNVTGAITLRLKDIAYTNAMKLIAESKGYAYSEDKTLKNLIKIQSKPELEKEPISISVSVLRYAKASDLKAVLTPMLTAQGKILVDTRSNTLIISDVPSNLTALQTLLEALDTQTPQVQIEAKFVERTHNPQKDLGVNWSASLLNHTIGLRSPNPSTPIQSVIVPPGGGSVTTSGSANPSPLEFQKNLGGGPWIMPSTIFDAGEMQVIFSFFNQDADTELLANPRVVTTDNGLAKISISTQYPIPQFQFNQQTGGLQINGFDYKDIGIILTVTPRINKDDFINLEVTPEASSENGFATLTSGGGLASTAGNSVQIPIIDTRMAKTTVLVKNGHTLALGGMIRQDVNDSYTKVPLMGDIPGLGTLFRSKSLNKLKRDLFIFLTPTIIRAEDQLVTSNCPLVPPDEPVFSNDKWMPRDSARPHPWFTHDNPAPASQPAAMSQPAPMGQPAPVSQPAPMSQRTAVSQPRPRNVSTNAPTQNFTPKAP